MDKDRWRGDGLRSDRWTGDLASWCMLHLDCGHQNPRQIRANDSEIFSVRVETVQGGVF